jgi:uncharacterized membrane protein YagU involved in acid resistance
MYTFRPGRAVFAGLAATVAMTALMLMAPVMGLPPMNVGAMLGSVMGGSNAIGWAAHFMVGAILALGFAVLFARRLPGPLLVRGMAYGVVPWLAAQLVVMPLMGAGLFSGSAAAALGSLMGHLVYGAVLGAVYGAQGGRGTVAIAPGS